MENEKKRLPTGALYLLAAVALVLAATVLVVALKSLMGTMPLPHPGMGRGAGSR